MADSNTDAAVPAGAGLWRKAASWLRNPGHFALALLIVSLAVRAYFLWRFWGSHPSAPNDYEEGDITRNLLAGRGYSAGPGWITPEFEPTAHKTPAYVAVLYVVYRLFDGSRFAATVVNSLLLAAAAPLAFVFMRRVFDDTVARVGAAALVVSPVLMLRGISVTNGPLAICVLLVFFLAYASAAADPSWGRVSLAGALMGAAVLTVPAIGAFGPAALWYLWKASWGALPAGLPADSPAADSPAADSPAADSPAADSPVADSPAVARPSGFRRAARALAAFVIAGALVLAPWTIRNLQTFGAFVPAGSSFPLEFAIGNNPTATGGLLQRDATPVMAVTPEQIEAARARGLNEVEAYGSYGAAAWRWARENPGRAARLRLDAANFYLFPQEFYYYPLSGEGRLRLLYTLWLVPFSLIGMVIAWRRFPRSRPFVQAFIWFSFVYVLTHANMNSRYREPMDALLAGFAAVAVVEASRWIRARRAAAPRG